MTRTDLVVVGGGPAGAVVAWRLASAGAAVALVDDGRAPWGAVGQQLSPSAFGLLERLGVADRLAEASTPVYEARSAWADSAVDQRPSLFNPYRPPLAVDRNALDPLLRQAARAAGARVLRARAKVTGRPGSWRVFGTPELDHPVPLVVDATGTGRTVSRGRLGWRGVDRLRCTVWQSVPTAPGPWSLVEAAPDGWWYTAPTATGAELTVMQVQDLAGRTPLVPPPRTAERLPLTPLARPTAQRVAVVGRAEPPWAPGLVAAGDAALSLDPLSSSGLRHALELATPAADAALGLLDRDQRPAERYAELVAAAFQRHLAERRFFHFAATRYRSADFWQRRSGLAAGQPN